MTIPPEASGHLRHGRKIEAIKATREATGLGLKEAKDAVEAHLANHPTLREEYRLAAGSESGSLVWVAIVLALAGIAAYIWMS